MNYRFKQCLTANVFKYFDDKCPLYMRDVFDKPCISQASTRNSTMKPLSSQQLKHFSLIFFFFCFQPLRRTNNDQPCISFLAPSVLNNLPNELLHLCLNIKLRSTFSTKCDRKITMFIFMTRLWPSQQLKHFFFNFFFFFFFFFLRFYPVLVYQFFRDHNGNK